MFQLTEIKEILHKNKNILIAKYNVKSLGVFGSYTRTDFTEESDIDILVDFEKPIGIEFIDLALELEKLLQHKVDLVSRKAIKPKLMKYVEKDLIYV